MDSKGIEVTQESVVQGLIALGYDEAHAKEAVRRAFKDAKGAVSLEDLIKKSLGHV
jgi:Holliday junction resolvasome RuvABC DNA-binding subunit